MSQFNNEVRFLVDEIFNIIEKYQGKQLVNSIDDRKVIQYSLEQKVKEYINNIFYNFTSSLWDDWKDK